MLPSAAPIGCWLSDVLCGLPTKVLIDYCVQLRGDFRELSVQIECPDTDFISAHVVGVIRLDELVCPGIQ